MGGSIYMSFLGQFTKPVVKAQISTNLPTDRFPHVQGQLQPAVVEQEAKVRQ